MAFSRRLGVVSILGACWFVAVGCGDDEDRKTGTEDGGEGGEGAGTSGTAGKSSVAGSQNNAGSAGEGGTTGGSAGSGNAAGEGGSGSGGDAGGGIVAGAGGETMGGGGEGGAPEPVAAMCKYQCDGPEDCTFADAVPYKCNLTTGSCAQCVEDGHCLTELSIWFFTCENDSGCMPDVEACVAADGVGYCATVPDAAMPQTPCPEGFPGIPRMLPRFGAQGDVEVCAADARCFDGACVYGCADPFGECGHGDGDNCNPTTGRCECEEGSECNTEVCGADSHCTECVTSNDCLPDADDTGLDTCVNGKCGCSDAAECPLTFVGNPPKLCE
ncbi:MAG TPA: hypothetical protein VJN18_10880 [Polyangiaceae bacterium]|nr:hypothetical protein [Polyangiaceae bacterium]